MINLEPYLDFIIKHKLTQSQYMFLYMLYYWGQNPEEGKELISKYRKAFPSDDGSIIGKKMTDDLIKREFIFVKQSPAKSLEDIVLSNKFLDMFVNKFQAGNEFWLTYPTFLTSGGKTMPLTAMDKNIFREIYWKTIRGEREEHKNILLDLAYAKENGLIKMKIENFVRSEAWVGIRNIRLGGETFAPAGNLVINEHEL